MTLFSHHSRTTLRSAVRSFIDLRAFAADPAAGVRLQPTADPSAFLASRRALALPDGPVEIGVIDLPAGEGTVDSLPGDEFVLAYEGAITLTQPGQALELRDGACAVLTRGSRFGWRAMESVTLIYMRYCNSPVGTGQLVLIDEAAPLEQSGAPLAELLIGTTPQCRNHTDYRSTDGEFTCGTWDSTPYHRMAMRYRHYELMLLLDGAVTLEDEAGLRRTFVERDIFLVEQNASCSWESRERVKKIYAIYRPA